MVVDNVVVILQNELHVVVVDVCTSVNVSKRVVLQDVENAAAEVYVSVSLEPVFVV